MQINLKTVTSYPGSSSRLENQASPPSMGGNHHRPSRPQNTGFRRIHHAVRNIGSAACRLFNPIRSAISSCFGGSFHEGPVPSSETHDVPVCRSSSFSRRAGRQVSRSSEDSEILDHTDDAYITFVTMPSGDAQAGHNSYTDPADNQNLGQQQSSSNRDYPSRLNQGIVSGRKNPPPNTFSVEDVNNGLLDFQNWCPFRGNWEIPSIFSQNILNECVGTGRFSEIYRFKNSDPHGEVALKVIQLDGLHGDIIWRTEREVQVQSGMDHRNVIRLDAAFSNRNAIILFLEYACGGDLHTEACKVDVFPVRRCLHIVRDICSGLKYMHDRGILHRNITPANILLGRDDVAKIGDFGVCGFLGPCNLIKGCCGTPGYQAPELLDNRAIGPKADVFALGVVLYNLLFGLFPFTDESLGQPETRVSFPGRIGVCEDVKNLLRGMLHRNPDVRFGTDDVLSHKIICKI